MLPDIMKVRPGERAGRVTTMKSIIAAWSLVARGWDGPSNPSSR
jgi:hypothetical protein